MAVRIGLEQIGAEIVLLGAKEFQNLINQTVKDIDKVNAAVKHLESESTKAFQAIAATATVAIGLLAGAVGAIGGSALKAGADYEQGLANIRGITFSSIADIKELDKVIVDLASHTRASIGDVTLAATELARGGLNVKEQAEGALKAVVDLSIASAGELGLERSAVLVASALKAFNLTGADSVRVVNAIATAAQNSAITFVDLQRSFQQAAPSAALFGLTVEQLAAVLGVMGQQGIRGSDAGTALKQTFQQLVNPGKQALEIMEKYKVSLFDGAGAIRPFRDLIIDIDQKFGDTAVAQGKLTEAQRDNALATIGGSDAIRALIVIAKRGVVSFDEFTTKMTDTTKSAAEMAKIMQNTLNAQIQIFVNNLGVLATKVGGSVIPIFKEFVANAIIVARTLQGVAELASKGIAFVITGKGFTEFAKQLTEVASAETAVKILGLIQVLLNIRTAILEQILPALGFLKDAIVKALPVQSLTDFLAMTLNLSTGIRIAAEVVTGFITVLANMVTAISNNAMATDILKAAIVGLLVLPIATFAIAFSPILLALGAAVVAATALSVAVGLLVLNFGQVQSTFAQVVTGIAGMVTAVANLATAASEYAVPALIALGIAAIGLGGYALVVASTAFETFALSVILSLIKATIAVSTFSAANVVAFAMIIPNALIRAAQYVGLMAAAFVGLGVASLGTLVSISTSFLTMSIVAVAAIGRAIISMGVFAAQMILMASLSGVTLLGGIRNLAVMLGTGLVTAANAGAVALFRLAVIGIGSAIAALISFLTYIAPVIAVLAILGLAAFALQKAWEENWLGIQGITQGVLQFIADKLGEFINFLSELPIIGDFVQGVGSAFSAAGGAIRGATAAAGGYVEELQGYRAELEGLIANAPKAISQADIAAMLEKSKTDVEAFTNSIAAAGAAAGTTGGSFDQLGDSAGGAGKKAGGAGKEFKEAESAITGFINAITKATRLQGYIDAFGDAGAKAIDALIDAVVSNVTADGAKAGEALHDFVQLLRKNNVPEWQALGESLEQAFAQALIDGSDDVIQAAVNLMAFATDAMKAQGRLTNETFINAFGLAQATSELGSQGANLIEAITDSIVKGTTDLVKEVGKTTQALMSKFIDDLPIDQARDFGRQLIDAVRDVIRDRSPEAIKVLQDLIKDLNFSAAISKLANARSDVINKLLEDSEAAQNKLLAAAAKDREDFENEANIKGILEANIEFRKDYYEKLTRIAQDSFDANKQLRSRDLEDLQDSINKERETEARGIDRAQQLADAKKKAMEKLSSKGVKQLSKIGDQTIGIVGSDDSDSEIDKLKKKWAIEDARRTVKEKQDAADKTLKRGQQDDEQNIALMYAAQLLNIKKTGENEIQRLKDAEENRQHALRLAQFTEKAQKEIDESNRKIGEVTQQEDSKFAHEFEKLTEQKILADTVFAGMLTMVEATVKGVKDIGTELTNIGFIGGKVTVDISRASNSSEGSPNVGISGNSGFAQGGLIPGIGPKRITAHGGEFVMSIEQVAMFERMFRVGNAQPSGTSNRVNNYNVNANYSTVQSPVDITDDLRALIALTS